MEGKGGERAQLHVARELMSGHWERTRHPAPLQQAGLQLALHLTSWGVPCCTHEAGFIIVLACVEREASGAFSAAARGTLTQTQQHDNYVGMQRANALLLVPVATTERGTRRSKGSGSRPPTWSSSLPLAATTKTSTRTSADRAAQRDMWLQLVERVCTLIGAAGSGVLLACSRLGRKLSYSQQLLASLASGPSHAG